VIWDEAFQPFIEQSPVNVMFRGTLERVFSEERLNQIFENHAAEQYTRELTFAACAEMLSLVVMKMRKSLHAAYRFKKEQVGVKVAAVYLKFARIEPRVCEALVRETAKDLSDVIAALPAVKEGPLPGLEVRIADGNHLQGTQHRLKELRSLGDAALPGHTLAVLDPQRELIEDLVVCCDGHANQKPLFCRLVEKAQPGQCWIVDRDFSTKEFLFGMQGKDARFLVRQHSQLLPELLGKRRKVGRTDTGTVYEQERRITHHGVTLTVRRITVELDQPTRDKETEIHLLTNLPPSFDAILVANAYVSRWKIEAAFHKLTTVLRCELNTLGYPKAALFGFSLAVAMYNAIRTVMAALEQAQQAQSQAAAKTNTPAKTNAKPSAAAKPARAKAPPKISFYYLADELSGVWRGMAIVIPQAIWTAAFGALTAREHAAKLMWLARRTRLDQFHQNPCTPK
jgi:IS4 transposase